MQVDSNSAEHRYQSLIIGMRVGLSSVDRDFPKLDWVDLVLGNYCGKSGTEFCLIKDRRNGASNKKRTETGNPQEFWKTGRANMAIRQRSTSYDTTLVTIRELERFEMISIVGRLIDLLGSRLLEHVRPCVDANYLEATQMLGKQSVSGSDIRNRLVFRSIATRDLAGRAIASSFAKRVVASPGPPAA